MMGEVPFVPPNLVPPDVKSIDCSRRCIAAVPCRRAIRRFWSIWEAAVRSMIETYPDADAYGIWTSELTVRTDDPQTQATAAPYAAARKLIPAAADIERQGNGYMSEAGRLDSDFAQACVMDKLVRRIKARHPKANLGVSMLFRSYLFRAARLPAAQGRLGA